MSATDVPQLLSIKTAATTLSVSEKTILRRIASGELSTIRIGRRVLIPAADLGAFVESHIGKLAA